MDLHLHKLTVLPLQKPMILEISCFSLLSSRVLIHYLSWGWMASFPSNYENSFTEYLCKRLKRDNVKQIDIGWAIKGKEGLAAWLNGHSFQMSCFSGGHMTPVQRCHLLNVLKIKCKHCSLRDETWLSETNAWLQYFDLQNSATSGLLFSEWNRNFFFQPWKKHPAEQFTQSLSHLRESEPSDGITVLSTSFPLGRPN